MRPCSRLEAMISIKVQAYFSMEINQGLRHIKKDKGREISCFQQGNLAQVNSDSRVSDLSYKPTERQSGFCLFVHLE